ncbi:MAG TPA: type II toxin-antitoxin system HicB family antitoxin [Ktedonobacteraceae bacterium]|jgi:predicted RNase H-like HicB family nuclease
MNPEHYSMLIQWDDDDKIYVVSVPELPGCKTHGKTREEAIKNGLEVIELWLETAKDLGWPIPQPQTVAA